ncbi:MAG: hypothetical protein P8016_03805, partial [Sedimentisphaerales bacterium]
YDVDAASTENFVRDVQARHALDAEGAESVEKAVAEADIVTTTTPVRSPLIKARYIRKGTHINAIGADAPGKQELEIELLKRAQVVIDNWEQSSHAGEINVAVSKNIIKREDICADIGEIVTGKKTGRADSEQITIFDSTGLAIQDIYSACTIYRALISQHEAELGKIAFFD